jgi:5-methylcytosine-specific restriction protein B
MNTADRSLAVVDFALRRRFSWYTLYPQAIKDIDEDKIFHKDLFNTISDLFDKYANDDELNLQPGQSYFITDKSHAEELIKERLIYEIMPLMKEYFAEGYMLKAKDEFCNFFYNETKIQMYL